MTDDRDKARLRELKGGNLQGAKRVIGGKLAYDDLLLLLRDDPAIRDLIRAAAARPEAVEPPADRVPAPASPGRETGREASREAGARHATGAVELTSGTQNQPASALPLAHELAPELALLALVKLDAEVATALLAGVEGGQGRELVSLIARAAQWSTILELWDRLAQRCKEGKAPASAGELEILAGCLHIHNAIWDGRQAAVTHVVPGATYDYRLHERGTPAGDVVRAEWLPGLVNAGGQVQKKPLVQT